MVVARWRGYTKGDCRSGSIAIREPLAMNEAQENDTSVVEPIVATRPRADTDQATQTRRQPPYNVVILNDEEHTFEYVIALLTKVFRHSLSTAEGLTWKIHSTGRAIVYTTHREKAELKRDQILGWGPDPRM